MTYVRLFRSVSRTIFLIMIAVFAVSASPSIAKPMKTVIVGYAERALIYPGGIKVRAKMDTGAFSTSLHAANVERFKRDGKDWVRFAIRFGGTKRIVEREIIRIARVRRARVGVRERPVILLGICVAGYYKLAQVNLTNRARMRFPLLIGRRFMATGGLVIASDRQFEAKEKCPKSISDK